MQTPALSPNQSRALAYIRDNPGCCMADVAVAVWGRKCGWVRTLVDRLVALKLVSCVSVGQKNALHVLP